MGLVGFGQPDDGVMQMCYLVPDIQAAMKTWVAKLNVGPWFLLDHFGGVNPKYRGQDSKADVSLAMSFAGHMNIELIEIGAGFEAAFSKFYRASIGWDGADPVRSFI